MITQDYCITKRQGNLILRVYSSKHTFTHVFYWNQTSVFSLSQKGAISSILGKVYKGVLLYQKSTAIPPSNKKQLTGTWNSFKNEISAIMILKNFLLYILHFLKISFQITMLKEFCFLLMVTYVAATYKTGNFFFVIGYIWMIIV